MRATFNLLLGAFAPKSRVRGRMRPAAPVKAMDLRKLRRFMQRVWLRRGESSSSSRGARNRVVTHSAGLLRPKSEIRNPKPETNLKGGKWKKSKTVGASAVLSLSPSDLGFVSGFGLRISDLSCPFLLQLIGQPGDQGIESCQRLPGLLGAHVLGKLERRRRVEVLDHHAVSAVGHHPEQLTGSAEYQVAARWIEFAEQPLDGVAVHLDVEGRGQINLECAFAVITHLGTNHHRILELVGVR